MHDQVSPIKTFMTPERETMEIEETNTTDVPEIHYRDFQIESGDTE